MSNADRIYEYIYEHRAGLVVDAVFAIAWVTVVTVLFNVLNGPQWVYYLCLLSGVVVYYGFFASLETARNAQ